MNAHGPPFTCPTCEAEMRPYERNGVVTDRCNGYRGHPHPLTDRP